VCREHHVEMFAIGIAGWQTERKERSDVAGGDESGSRDRSTFVLHDALSDVVPGV
jgi:hypothetical protein